MELKIGDDVVEVERGRKEEIRQILGEFFDNTARQPLELEEDVVEVSLEGNSLGEIEPGEAERLRRRIAKLIVFDRL